MYKDTVTLFNRLEGTEGDMWYPTVLRNVQLTIDRAAIQAKYGAESADSAVLHVRYADEDGIILVSGKPWEPPKAWERLLDHSAAITFTPGDRFDFFWLGDWGSEEPIEDTATLGTDFYTRMNKKYDFVFAITKVGGPFGVIPHFEIMGK